MQGGDRLDGVGAPEGLAPASERPNASPCRRGSAHYAPARTRWHVRIKAVLIERINDIGFE